MIYKTPEQTPGYKGLFNEVVTEDCYHIKNLSFIPDLIIDIGANIGVFTRFARSLFPNALIISVEPNETNYAHLTKFTKDPNCIFINKALGQGNIWRATTAINGSGECYLSEGLGYPAKEIENDPGNLVKSNIKTLMLPELINQFLQPNTKSLIKIDCEGAENVIWEDEESMKCLKQIDFITCELHFYAHIGGVIWQEVQDKTHTALKSFNDTHQCNLTHIYFTALKK